MQRTGAHLYFEFAAEFVLYFVFVTLLSILLILFCIIFTLSTCPPACRDDKTPLKLAIDKNKPDVEALLRSVGASQ